MFLILNDGPRIQAIRGAHAIRGVGGRDIQGFICQPRYMAGLIYGPRGPPYNGSPLYTVFVIFLKTFVK